MERNVGKKDTKIKKSKRNRERKLEKKQQLFLLPCDAQYNGTVLNK